MKWFKHDTDPSKEDPFLEIIEDEFGLEGYARWWKLMERIGAQMDETDRCYAEHSWPKWQTFLVGKRNKLLTYLKRLESLGKINLEENGNILRIYCPNLLKRRDEYTRKSGHKQDKNPDNVAVKIEIENKREKEDKSSSSYFPLSRSNPPDESANQAACGKLPAKKQGYPPEFEAFWEKYPPDRRREKPNALKAWREAIRKTTPENLLAALARYGGSREVLEGFSPYPAKWLRQERWNENYEGAHAKSDGNPGKNDQRNANSAGIGPGGVDTRDPARRAADEAERVKAKIRAEFAEKRRLAALAAGGERTSADSPDGLPGAGIP